MLSLIKLERLIEYSI